MTKAFGEEIAFDGDAWVYAPLSRRCREQGDAGKAERTGLKPITLPREPFTSRRAGSRFLQSSTYQWHGTGVGAQ
eukprot:scaffold8700_cov31-Tisochrysis_lutea.AAC.7